MVFDKFYSPIFRDQVELFGKLFQNFFELLMNHLLIKEVKRFGSVAIQDYFRIRQLDYKGI